MTIHPSNMYLSSTHEAVMSSTQARLQQAQQTVQSNPASGDLNPAPEAQPTTLAEEFMSAVNLTDNSQTNLPKPDAQAPHASQSELDILA
jgi:hypothetical protein